MKKRNTIPSTIKRAYTRHYSDNGQTMDYIDWSDGSRTEGIVEHHRLGIHMLSLFQRAQREGITIETETW